MTLKTWSFSKKHNSTAQPAGASRDYNVVMKENTSIESPVFILGTGIDAGISYCQWSGNYYFVDDIVLISADQVELHCSIDVLATHKAAIGAYTAFIERAASAFNTMLSDGAVSRSQEILGESFYKTDLFENKVSSSGTYILGVIGRDSSETGGISVYMLSPEELGYALDFMFDENNSEYDDFINDAFVKTIFNPFQYVVFLRWYPLTKAAFGTATPTRISYGWYKTPIGRTFDKLSSISIVGAATLDIPTPYYTDFRGYDSNFTQLYIDIPTVGFIELDPTLLYGTGIKLLVGLSCDIVTGDSIIYIERVTGAALTTRERICKFSGQLGASIPVGQVNSSAGSLAMSAGNIIAGAITKNPSAVAGGVEGIAGSLKPMGSVIGNYSSRASLSDMTEIKVSQRTYKSGGLLTTQYGRPLEEARQISTLSGFVKCREASIALAAPDTEIDRVNAYLNSGFYYE